MTDPQPLFAALSDPTRRAVYERLVEAPASATALAAELPISRQAVAKHLAALDAAGLVAKATHGREVRYTAQVEPLRDMTRWVDRVAAEWDTRLERLRRSLD